MKPRSPLDARPAPRVDILGVEVSAIDLDDAVSTVEHWIATRRKSYVCITGVHGLMESRKDPTLRDIHNRAGLVTPDGMPLVWTARRKGFSNVTRVYGPDLMRRLTARSAETGYRNFYFGGGEGIAERLAGTLTAAHPGLKVAGTFTPPFRPATPEEDEAVIARINAARPDILWVGLSTPKQEYWMAAHAARLHVPVMVGVGAAFDFLAGTKRQAPPWMQARGLEWLFRLRSEPRRLWRRYLTIVPGFLALMALEAARGRLAPKVPPAA